MKDIIVFSGSTRTGSLNTKLAHYAAALLKKQEGLSVELLDLADYEMPFYNGDMESESGLPKNARAFKSRLQKCDGFFITSPEYNGFFTPLLKNTLDWASRPHGDAEKDKTPTYQGKIAGIASSSPGPLGGLRGLPHLRILLSGIGVHVVPIQTSVGNGLDAFNEDGSIKVEGIDKMFQSQIEQFAKTVKAL